MSLCAGHCHGPPEVRSKPCCRCALHPPWRKLMLWPSPNRYLPAEPTAAKAKPVPGAEALVFLDLDLFAGIDFSNPSVEV